MTTFESGEVIRKLGSRLKMRHLLLLLQIQRHGSLTRAAEHMATSQPAVTNALTEIEHMFGVPLFERSPRGMLPTAMGSVVLMRAQAMVHDLDHLVGDMAALAAGQAAHLHIGVTPFVSGALLSNAIRRTLPEAAQRLTVTVHEGTSDQLLPRLLDHTLDIVIGRAQATADQATLNVEVLYRQPPRLIASRRLAARLGRNRLDWAKLGELDWILGAPNTPMRSQVTDLFLNAGVAAPVPIVESYSSRLIGELIVASERAISIVPADIAEELVRIAGVAVVPYSFDWQLAPIAMFTRANRLQRAVEYLFADSLRAAGREVQMPMTAQPL